ncbi:glycosyltransferase family 2 protein [Parabacteroides hominis]|uniref:Glycosyltransferase family 2 protein n=2 Tax=Parabacteroides TaxID=375288 RepID=A0ABR7DMM2_9BACT|nr:glycosyltransferase family A protein [Parabacteroides hominis]MBC5632686.1 glycosyltransferase family 2 protein [Parabacteroides hominis]
MEENKKVPLISVVIPLFNKEKVVLKTLESVTKQTFTDFEVVVINDGSTDRSVGIVSQFISDRESLSDQPNIRLINKPNGGVSSARNRGIQEAKGEYVAFLDADDEWMPDFLYRINELIVKYPMCDVFATLYAYREPDKFYEADIKGFTFDSIDGIVDNYFVMSMLGRPPLWTSSIVVSKRAISSIGGFPAMKMGEDILTWAQLACRYKIAYYRKALSVYNRLPESYETGSYQENALPSPNDDIGCELLRKLCLSYPHVKGLKSYCFLWHKMRFVMLVSSGRKIEAVQEWTRTLPMGFLNLDCYYRLFLNIFSRRYQEKIKMMIGKY